MSERDRLEGYIEGLGMGLGEGRGKAVESDLKNLVEDAMSEAITEALAPHPWTPASATFGARAHCTICWQYEGELMHPESVPESPAMTQDGETR